MENHLSVIAALSASRPLWGVPADRLKEVRDPWILSDALKESGTGLLMPPLRRAPPDGIDDGSWLVKQFHSAGGQGVRAWRPASNNRSHEQSSQQYWQRRVSGQLLGVVYCSTSSSSTMLSVTRQLIGESWPGASDFGYVGSIGPLTVNTALSDQLVTAGAFLARRFGLLGLFGIDLIVDDDQPWLLEVNPRPTASVEIWERATGKSAMAMHAAVFDPEFVPPCSKKVAPTAARAISTSMHGKAIAYADRTVSITSRTLEWIESKNRGQVLPAIADIPIVGQSTPKHAPICTVFAAGTDEKVIELELRQLCNEVLMHVQDIA